MIPHRRAACVDGITHAVFRLDSRYVTLACDPYLAVLVFLPVRLLESIEAVDCMACIAEGFDR